VAESPKLSVVVVLRQSANQAEHALHSLSPQFQRNVRADDYEIIVVEAPSSDTLGEARARARAENLRYFSLDAAAAWRASALSFGVEQCRAPNLGVLFDGSHIVTPRVVELALSALGLGSRPLVFVPEYCLGKTPELAAQAEAVDWRSDSDPLFASSRFGPANPNGFLGPMLGTVCSFFPLASFREVGGFEPRLDGPGGGALSLGLYTRLCLLKGAQLIALAGEGAFRQLHPEVDTPERRAAESSLQALIGDRAFPQGPGFRAVHREPIVFGPIPGPAQRFVASSAELAHFHCVMCDNRGDPSWYEDPP
jgi:hypothetical protein